MSENGIPYRGPYGVLDRSWREQFDSYEQFDRNFGLRGGWLYSLVEQVNGRWICTETWWVPDGR